MNVALASILTFVFFLCAAPKKIEAKEKSRSPNQEAVSKSEWKITTHDGQEFSLIMEKIEDKVPEYSLQFSRGQRELQKLPVPERFWKPWRTRLTQIMEETSPARTCPHHHKFTVQISMQKPKEKLYCAEDLSPSLAQRLKTLSEEFTEYLYGL